MKQSLDPSAFDNLRKAVTDANSTLTEIKNFSFDDLKNDLNGLKNITNIFENLNVFKLIIENT